ncbi:hypothetical protein SADUNF_Sadunf08G0165000 [Salix dunnii]|uniref:TCTP domain-containing protein n=1 Tax=Salix dunnii TaxID=1413687 RepID=A0A835K1V7_9ROSI|nr:hypothetical protein SADUNF_Sadunf08G0165000 [Salix dunnii]
MLRVVQGSVDVDIGANPSAEGGNEDEDEGVDDQSVKVVHIVDTFRLQVSFILLFVEWLESNLLLTRGSLLLIKLLSEKLDVENKEHFKKNIEGATKFLISKIKDLQL